MQAALEMEEALYMQRQQELQRDLQLQRLLLQDRLDQQALLQGAGGPGSALNAASLFELQYGGGGLAAVSEKCNLNETINSRRLKDHLLPRRWAGWDAKLEMVDFFLSR